MTKISETLIKKIDRSIKSKVFEIHDIQHLKNVKSELNILIQKIYSNPDYDPVFKIYIIAQNILSVFIEEVSKFKEFNKFNKDFHELEYEFMPAGPPMSPLTKSYFTYWLFFDYKLGKKKETIGSLFLEISKTFNIDEKIIKAVKYLNDSYMSFYQVIEINRKLIKLKELITDNVVDCICPSGYKGNNKDIIYARIVPNLFDRNDYSIIVTTPYIIILYQMEDWVSFFNRQGINKSDNNYVRKFINFLKYGHNLNYWNNYIMDAYVNHTDNCIYLTGIPDIKGSKPHEL